MIRDHEKCFAIWQTEVESRVRKQYKRLFSLQSTRERPRGELGSDIKVMFLRKCDTSKVSACKQEPDEPVQKQPPDVFNEAVASTWEQSLIGVFRLGMLPHLAEAIIKSCVGNG